MPWAKEGNEAKLRLLIDMDEVICMFLEELCNRYNKEFGASLAPDQLQQYDLTNFVGEEGKLLFQQAGFFDCLQPFPAAIEVLERLLREGYEIIIATDTKENQAIQADKMAWIKNNLPFFPLEQVFFTREKHLLAADLIFDDSPDVVARFPGIKVIMDRPYNKDAAGYRIYDNNWQDFYALVEGLRDAGRTPVTKPCS